MVVAEEAAGTRVEILDPAVMSGLSPSDAVAEVAAEARERLVGMMDALLRDEGGPR